MNILRVTSSLQRLCNAAERNEEWPFSELLAAATAWAECANDNPIDVCALLAKADRLEHVVREQRRHIEELEKRCVMSALTELREAVEE